MKLTRMHIGGVPEHFNLPWHLALEQGLFADAGVDLIWRDCPGGSGEMTAALAAGELDLAVTLSSGTIAAQARGCPIRILGWYIATPLIWGVHVPAQSDFRNADELEGQRFAISRFGSGSHLMASVLAKNLGWDRASDLNHVVVKNLQGAVDAFAAGEAEGFLWERFTTQPLVDQGLMRRVDECPTPWPAFMLVATEQVLADRSDEVAAVWAVILQQCRQLKQLPDLVERIAVRYQLDGQQVEQWLGLTEWTQDTQVQESDLQAIIDLMQPLDLLDNPLQAADCVSTLSDFVPQ